jgi:hypothetical protein|tara:strand:+ start:826 stop:1851 length:1026 start_codon:yes stop_codon:yes gene_type:complete
MPVPSSGQLRLRADINQEINDNDTDTNVSLGTLSDDAGFDAPDTMSEFYGYTSFITPTVTQATTSNVYDTTMKLHGSMQSPSGGNVQYGWYFGTSSTMLNNSFIHDGNNNGSTSTINFDYTKGGLSGSTTYYIWTAVRDLSGNVLSSASVKTQATLAAANYTNTWLSGSQNQVYVEASDGVGGNISGSINNAYNHVYYGWSGLSGSTSATTPTVAQCGQWYSANSPNYSLYAAWRSSAATVNRCVKQVNFNFSGSDRTQCGIGSSTSLRHTLPSSISGASYYNRTVLSTSITGSNYNLPYYGFPNTGQTFSGGMYQFRPEFDPSGVNYVSGSCNHTFTWNV